MKKFTKASGPDTPLIVEPSTDVLVGVPIRILAPKDLVNVEWHVDPPVEGLGLLPADWSDDYTVLAEPNSPGDYTVHVRGDGRKGSMVVIHVTNGGGLKLAWIRAAWERLRRLFQGGRFAGYVLMLVLGLGVGYSTHGGCQLPVVGGCSWPKPDPTDPFVIELQAAFSQEKSDRSALPGLIAACRDASRNAESDSVQKTRQLRDMWASEVASSVAPKLPHTRGVIVRRLDSKLPTTDMTLTPELRHSIATEFETIAKALDQVGD